VPTKKHKPIIRILRAGTLAVALLVFGGIRATADPLGWEFQLNTSSLPTNQGPFYLAFQLEDGSGTGDANNTVTLYNFDFYGGSAAGSPVTFGGATGSLETGITITDSDPFFNAIYEGFTPGPMLTFDADFTDNADVGPFQDQMLMSILDPTLNGIPTLDPSGLDSFLTVTLDGTTVTLPNGVVTPPLAVYSSDLTQTTYNIPAGAAVPEAGSLTLLFTCCAMLGLKRKLLPLLLKH